MSRPERELSPARSPVHRFGFELRRLRKVRGVSQSDLGALVHVSGDLVYRIEIGERRPSRDFAQRSDRVLDAGGWLLTLWDAIPAGSRRAGGHTDIEPVGMDKMSQKAHPSARDAMLAVASGPGGAFVLPMAVQVESGDFAAEERLADAQIVPCMTIDGRIIWVSVPRRSFLLGGIGALAGVGIGVPLSAEPAQDHLRVANFTADAAPLEHFQHVREVLRDGDNLFGPGRMLPMAREQIGRIQALRKHVRGNDKHRLLGIQVEFADLLAWLYQDEGRYGEARHWLDRALGWCHLSGNDGAAAFVLARKSQLASDMLDGADAVGLAEAARRLAKSQKRTAGIAATYAAHGYALQGDRAACQREYDRAHDALAKTAGERTSWYGMFFDAAYIEAQHARSLQILGDHGPAATASAAALRALPRDYYRDRGVYLTWHALALAGDSRPDEAATAALQALAVWNNTRSGRLMASLEQVSTSLQAWHTEPTVTEFHEAWTALH